jgi:hypothetical protein
MTGSSLDHSEGQSRLRGLDDIMSRQENDASVWKSIPGFAKIVMLLQTLVISFLSFWIYQEYLNNAYFQAYVNGSLQASLTGIILVSIGSFTIVGLVLFGKLRSARRELGGIRSKKRFGSDGRESGHLLDTRVEQHLIEMIRKTQPIITSGTSDRMPTLRRIDSQSPEE